MDNDLDIIVLKFADSKIPVFKESRNKDYIKYGDDNKYPEYLTYLFNKSAKHNAILTGKANYIFGGGFENGDITVNRLGESLNDIARKAILDVEIYGGYRLEIIWNKAGKIGEIYHVDYTTLRLAKDGGFYYKENWDLLNRDEPEYINAFNPSEPVGSQVYAYNEYRPMTRYYPLPTYIGCNNYIETDIEISKFYLSSIRNGMAPSKMIQFFQGEPSEDKKRQIEKRFKDKFGGSENAGQFILVFGSDKNKSVQIDDLSGSEQDKMFQELNKTCQQEIFSGHLVTNGMLFGIETEGKLGASTELKTSYEIFVNTYAKPKAEVFSKEISYLLSFSNYPGEYKINQTDPIGIQLTDALIEKSISPDEVREILGLPVGDKQISSDGERLLKAMNTLSPLVANKVLESLTKNQILGMVGIAPTPEGDVVPTADGTPVEPTTQKAPENLSNENIKNLTAKQHQQVLRIIREYSKGKLTELAAKTLLRTGYGLSEEDINNLLGIEPQAPNSLQMASEDVDSIIGVFDSFGDDLNDYEILKSKKVCCSVEDLEVEENIFKESFKTLDVTYSESQILDLLKKDPKITPEVIARIIGQTVVYVQSKLDSLKERGIIEATTITIGTDTITEWTTKEVLAPPVKIGGNPPAKISIRYSYEGPKDSRNRPFCAKLLSLHRLYSRADIETISARLGYSVFDRGGGWWTKPNGEHSPSCRHHWKSNIVVKK